MNKKIGSSFYCQTIEQLLSVIAISDYVWNFSHNFLKAALKYFLP